MQGMECPRNASWPTDPYRLRDSNLWKQEPMASDLEAVGHLFGAAKIAPAVEFPCGTFIVPDKTCASRIARIVREESATERSSDQARSQAHPARQSQGITHGSQKKRRRRKPTPRE
jgi:hypothetical protein